MLKIAQRGKVAPFRVMEVLEKAWKMEKEGASVCHLSIGQPSATMPDAVKQKLVSLLQSETSLGYTEALGIPALREAISNHYRDVYGADVPASRIIATVGSSAATFMALMSAFDAGDKVAIAVPFYPAYPTMLEALGLEAVYLHTTLETGFQPTVEMLEALPEKPAGLIIASPSNPAGTVIDADALRELARYCETHRIRLISDEIYHGIVFEGKHYTSAAALSPHAIVVNSFSKYFLMPGWRLGWAVVPEDLVPSFEALLQNFFISPPAISQHAAVEIFRHKAYLDNVVAGYARNRALLLEALPRMGFTRLAPSEGAFYLFADVSHLTNDSQAFCAEMLAETGVSTVPGIDFDKEQGQRFVRFSFCGSEEKMRDALARLEPWMAKRFAASRMA